MDDAAIEELRSQMEDDLLKFAHSITKNVSYSTFSGAGVSGQIRDVAREATSRGFSGEQIEPLLQLLYPCPDLPATLTAAMLAIDVLLIKLAMPEATSLNTKRGRSKGRARQKVEPLLAKGLNVDAICERTGESAANVRQIRFRHKRKT